MALLNSKMSFLCCFFLIKGRMLTPIFCSENRSFVSNKLSFIYLFTLTNKTDVRIQSTPETNTIKHDTENNH